MYRLRVWWRRRLGERVLFLISDPSQVYINEPVTVETYESVIWRNQSVGPAQKTTQAYLITRAIKQKRGSWAILGKKA